MTVELGVNISNDARQAGADCALAAQLGAKWVRVSIEQSDGTALHDLQAIVDAAHSHGLLVYQTCQPTGHRQPRTQAEIDRYAAFVVACAQIADAVERDNESNGFGSDETPDPSACATSMLACIELRNKAAPGRRLVTDSLCPAGGAVGSSYVEPLAFITAFLKAQPTITKARNLWYGWHGYCDFRYPATTDQWWNTCHRARDAAAMIRTTYGVDPRIASSEFGAATGPAGFAQAVTPAGQAADFDAYMKEARAQTKANAVRHGPWIWYALRDRTSSGADDWPAFCGLVDIHGAAKPVAARFTLAAAA